MFTLGIMEHKKRQNSKALGIGFDLINQSAEKGNAKAIDYLAMSYKNGIGGVEQNIEKVKTIFIFFSFFIFLLKGSRTL